MAASGTVLASGPTGTRLRRRARRSPVPTAPGSARATPTAPTEGGARFERLEWAFDLSKSYANPYYSYDPADTRAANPAAMTWVGAEGVSVDLHLTAPSGTTLTVPAFWQEGYLRVSASNLQ